MIEEHATVVAVEGAYVRVRAQRQSTCGQCHARQACGVSALADFLARRQSSIRVANPLGARAGDHVVLGVREDAVLRAALAAYGLPLLLLLAVAFSGARVAAGLGVAGDAGAIAGAVFGLGVGFLWLRLSAARRSADSRYEPVVLRVENAVSPAAHEPGGPGGHRTVRA
ncbi:MAG: SoxR reducing system RseC family protein [Ectothiorhodospiraceae bacterium]